MEESQGNKALLVGQNVQSRDNLLKGFMLLEYL